MAKITKATFKAFIRKNEKNLLIKEKSRFDGMTDCVMPVANDGFTPISAATYPCDNNLGFAGVWLVHGSRDSFEEFHQDGLRGISVWNCCGSFTVAVRI